MQTALHHGLECGQALRRGVAQTLIAADHMTLGGRLLVLIDYRGLECGDLAVETVLVPSPLGPLLGEQPEMIEVSASNAAALGNPLSCGELIGHVEVPRLGPDLCAVRSGVGAQADPAHRLDAAGDSDVNSTGGDQSGDQMIGLLGAAALAIHGGSADRLGQARGQPGDPGDVVGLLPVLRHAATDDLFNGSGVDSRFIDERLLYGAQQFSGVQPGQPTSALSDRAAGGVDDHRIPHGTRLEHVPLL